MIKTFSMIVILSAIPFEAIQFLATCTFLSIYYLFRFEVIALAKFTIGLNASQAVTLSAPHLTAIIDNKPVPVPISRTLTVLFSDFNLLITFLRPS